MAKKKKFSVEPASFFLIASLVLGILLCVVIPYGAGFDEERHLTRIYFMSEYHFMPNFPNPIMYEEVSNLSYQRRFVQSPAFDMFSRETFWRKFNRAEENIRYGVRTQSIYSPVIFLPQALIGRALWWKFDFPVLPTIILQRMAGLLIYIAGAYVAIRVIPYGKWIFAALALLPAAMYQASTLNADGFTTGVSFAFVGWVIAVYVNEDSGIRPRSVWILAGLSLLLGVAKPGAIVLLPLLLMLVKHPLPSKRWGTLLVAGVILAVAANIGWWSVASQGSTFSAEGAQSISRQSSLIFSAPLGFIKLLLQAVMLTFSDQVQGWVAGYGYGAGTVPGAVYAFSAFFLIAAFLSEPRTVNVSARTRVFLVGMFLLSCAAIYTIAFSANYATGGILALAKHGRYYIPFAPLFFLSIAGSFTVRENLQRLMRRVTVVSFLLVTVYYSLGIYTAYYTYCGYEAYTGDMCILPVYKNLEKEGVPEAAIHQGVLATQTFTNYCGELQAVEVYIKSVPEGQAGSMRFSLLDGQGGQVLASRDFPVGEIAADSYLELPVSLPPDHAGEQYVIQLTSEDLPPDDSVRATLTPRDYYPGLLTVNGVSSQSDLLIHYTCDGP